MTNRQGTRCTPGEVRGQRKAAWLIGGMVDWRISLILFLLVFLCYSYFLQQGTECKQ
jgi:hypothetical protein